LSEFVTHLEDHLSSSLTTALVNTVHDDLGDKHFSHPFTLFFVHLALLRAECTGPVPSVNTHVNISQHHGETETAWLNEQIQTSQDDVEARKDAQDR